MNTLRLELELVRPSANEELMRQAFREADPENLSSDLNEPTEPRWKGTPYADELEIPRHATLDYVALVISAFKPGDYYIFNCSCGMPQCASIEHPIAVTHENNVIRWHILDSKTKRRFAFSKEQYAAAILSFLREVQNTVPLRELSYEFRIGLDYFSPRNLAWCIKTLETGITEGTGYERL